MNSMHDVLHASRVIESRDVKQGTPRRVFRFFQELSIADHGVDPIRILNTQVRVATIGIALRSHTSMAHEIVAIGLPTECLDTAQPSGTQQH